jgi:diguanylate cyclase (GGDEF)-like protein
MKFYLATSFIFPRSLRLRLFTVCFVATHLPLIAYCIWGLATGRIALVEFALLVAATLVGTGVALMGIGALLSPIHALADALHNKDGVPPALPQVGDVIHTLYAGVQQAAQVTRTHITDLSLAAHEDPLTGIANRRGFLAQLQALPADQRRGCLAIVDIDHFKQVNDLLGHDEGDRVLCAFAGRLSGLLRRADLVARWGGEEFAILFRNCVEDEASWALTRIAEQMRDDPIALIEDRPLTFSAGICAWNDGDIATQLRHADAALYHAKHTGRDRICRAAPLKQTSAS